jgi:hypothetical protein
MILVYPLLNSWFSKLHVPTSSKEGTWLEKHFLRITKRRGLETGGISQPYTLARQPRAKLSW